MAGVSASLNVDGILVTMPHKFAAFAYCATSSERAKLLKVVSVIRRNADRTWHGGMLGGLAFVKAQREHGAQIGGARALLVGAGGLPRSCAVGPTVNGRVHRTTKRVRADMLEQERARLHPVPALPHTITFGETRTVAVNTPMVSHQGGLYSVPHRLLGETVRVHGAGRDERVVILHVGDRGAIEAARHPRAEPGIPQMDDDHFPPAPAGAINREPRAGNVAEAAFLGLGDGAALWLKEAAAQGSSRIRVKMAHAVSIAKLTNPVCWPPVGRSRWPLTIERSQHSATLTGARLKIQRHRKTKGAAQRALRRSTAGSRPAGKELHTDGGHQGRHSR